jgi:U3 small nucleolar RNA-associated protein 6
MIDTISTAFESALHDLAKLEGAGLLTSTESRQILKRRSEYERFVAKRGASCERSFFAYIDYEKNLYRLVRSRFKAHGSKKKIQTLPLARHLQQTLIRSVSQNTWSLRLWGVFIRHCESQGSMKLLSRVIAKALRFHSARVGLWLYAACLEFERNHNVNAARLILQRGLRSCGNSKEIWIAFFNLEINHANNIRLRKDILLSERKYVGNPESIFDVEKVYHSTG